MGIMPRHFSPPTVQRSTTKQRNMPDTQTNKKTVEPRGSVLYYEKITIIAVHFAHASPWLFTIPITKSFLDFVHILLKCGSRTEATYLSPKNSQINN